MGTGRKKSAGSDAAALETAARQKGIDEIRSMFDMTAGELQPFITAGAEALPEQVRGTTIGGFGDRLGEILSGGALNPLIQERTRAIENRQGATGLSRSGAGLRQIADIPAQLGLDIENMLFGRTANLAGTGLGTALQKGRLGQGAASNIANIFGKIGEAQSSGLLTDRQAEAALIGEGFDVAGSLIPKIFGGAGATAATGGAGQILGTVLPMIFGSDPDLKENIEEVGEISFPDDDFSLKIYQWDWIPEAKGTFIEKCPTLGFMSDEVKEKYPGRVEKFGGYDMIAYFDLLDDLETVNNCYEAIAA